MSFLQMWGALLLLAPRSTTSDAQRCLCAVFLICIPGEEALHIVSSPDPNAWHAKLLGLLKPGGAKAVGCFVRHVKGSSSKTAAHVLPIAGANASEGSLVCLHSGIARGSFQNENLVMGIVHFPVTE